MNAHAVAQSLQPLSKITTALQVRALRDAAAPDADQKALIKSLRDQVFNYRHTAEALVAKVDRSPRLCAGVLVLIAQRMAYSRVHYDLFDEIVDKEFMAQAMDYITTQMAKVVGVLPEYEIVEVFEMATAYEQIDDLQYFIEHIDIVQTLPALHQRVHTDITRRAILGAIAGVMVTLCIASAWAVAPFLMPVWLVLATVAGAIYLANQRRHADAQTRATKTCDDVDRVRVLLARYKSKEIAKRELEEHKRTVKAFFGDMSPTSHMTGIFSVIQMHIHQVEVV
ncbi:MAG: hypothetical protein RLY87_676 [Chloroflexota bacterium]